MTGTDFRPLILIPSYNTGGILPRTVEGVLKHAGEVPVWVVIDGSTDGSPALLEPLSAHHAAQLRMLTCLENGGKGHAILHALEPAKAAGFTHVLTIDSDGQHPPDFIEKFLGLGADNPDCLIMGKPIFGCEAPFARVHGRKISHFWTDVETLGSGLGDTLFGMRLYPLDALITAFEQTHFARGYDFDVEIAVRITWLGHPAIQIDVPVRYLKPADGGISHFRYLRDNLKMIWLHARLLPEFFLWRIFTFRKPRRPSKTIPVQENTPPPSIQRS